MSASPILSNNERLVVNSEVQKNGKSTGVAYAFWFFLSAVGGHRFYLGHKGSAIAQLILTLTLVGAIVSGIWAIIDAFLIPGMIRDFNQKVENEATQQVVSNRSDNND
ncbi:TM2 domain-containing protein [Sporolactobacillus shoreicorticis]|uniref:TM2 domain-containing protein n=1 Tax=Sporolactobacillus shoreicorticis TaxID=1923877 RepID=A0ABW5S6I4_9BACL|nr:TM2 domain-containing protein [Sporolactobacillus shoreicorticis]MCO7126603.1 TM2 domain-containing protein [Sporolactobacillus shoreicorticis]